LGYINDASKGSHSNSLNDLKADNCTTDKDTGDLQDNDREGSASDV
jgi:hypothetical protein